jgi:hypothetical protein
VGTDVTLLRDLCERTLIRTDFSGLGRRVEGKVRDNYVREGSGTTTSAKAGAPSW